MSSSFSIISRSNFQRRRNGRREGKNRALSTAYTRKSTDTELIILASTRPQTQRASPPCDRYSIFATTRWHVYGNIRDVVMRRPNIRPGPWTFQLIIRRVDLNQSPISLSHTHFSSRFSASHARNLSLARNVFHAIPRPIKQNSTLARTIRRHVVRFPRG